MSRGHSEKIRFLEFQKPSLEAGSYKITVGQSIKHKTDPTIMDETFPVKTLRFFVQGERFSLVPDAVHAMFPPPGSIGRRSDCLPHISIVRSTFPWERSAYGEEDYEPWLALLLFDEEEVNSGDFTTRTMTLAELKSSSDATFPAIELEPGQNNDDKMTVIDVKKKLLADIMPTGGELKLLAHVRKKVRADEAVPETELAVIMTNRLPRSGSGSTMHLVSVENRYDHTRIFDYQQAAADDFVRLVSLQSWSFACVTETGKDFEELVEDLDTGVPRLPNPDPGAGIDVEKYLSRGYVALPHRLRQCDQTYSWYHGPLGSHDIGAGFNRDEDLPDFGDALVRYHQDIGMFDVSYAAAFELGRSMALEDRQFASALYRWKNHVNQEVCLAMQGSQYASQVTVAHGREQEGLMKDALEVKIREWFKNLALLEDIPFNYLVPDEAMLPRESIRFFILDRHWVECLCYGAFTIGGTLRPAPSGNNVRCGVFDRLTAAGRGNISGFIIRSQLISGYPDIQVDSYENRIANGHPLPKSGLKKPVNIRSTRLGPDTLFCLYKGRVNTLEFYLKPEGLRFGLDEEEASDGVNMKYEKDVFKKMSSGNVQKITVPLAGLIKDGGKRVIKITDSDDNGIADRIRIALGLNTIDSAVFGMHMLEGSNKGRLVIE